MYLKAVMTIDPTQLTEIDRVKPTKGFGRIAYYLTAGLHQTEEERETFCALSILQQINLVMRSIGINNVVRLAKDDIVFYEDKDGQDGDLKLALDQFSKKADPDRIKAFDALHLVLEHEVSDVTFLIDIRIKRKHAVGEFPITVTVNGLPNRIAAESSSTEQARLELARVFSSQENYDAYVDQHRKTFDAFIAQIETAFKTTMSVDDVHTTSNLNIIRPKNRVAHRDEIPISAGAIDDSDPLFHNHRDYDDSLLFAWMWADLCHDYDIHCTDCSIVDTNGQAVLEVGSEGFQAGEGSTLNVDEPFCVPVGNDIEVLNGHDFSAEVSHFGNSSSGWLDSIGGSFDGDSDAGSGCGASSCGSSCGSGCGGGD